jgi:hypothetical protein
MASPAEYISIMDQNKEFLNTHNQLLESLLLSKQNAADNSYTEETNGDADGPQMAQDNSKYSKPELRESIKDRVMAGSKGGKPGQWSARKAQLVAQQYEKAGGGYKGGKGEKQKSLEKWGKEKWSTKDEYEKRAKAKSAAKKYKESKS